MSEIEFWDRAFMTALESLIEVWGKKEIEFTSSRDSITRAAAEMATSGLRQRREAIRSIRPLGIEKMDDNGIVKVGS